MPEFSSLNFSRTSNEANGTVISSKHLKGRLDLVMHKMPNVKSPTGKYTYTNLTKTFYNTLWFCILKSLHNVLKSPQITPEVPKSLHLGHIFLLGLAKTVFLYCPPPLPKPREAPHTSNGLSVAAFRFKSEKKTYQWSQLGKIDPKDYWNKGVS